jgi:hypothetical protein
LPSMDMGSVARDQTNKQTNKIPDVPVPTNAVGVCMGPCACPPCALPCDSLLMQGQRYRKGCSLCCLGTMTRKGRALTTHAIPAPSVCDPRFLEPAIRSPWVRRAELAHFSPSHSVSPSRPRPGFPAPSGALQVTWCRLHNSGWEVSLRRSCRQVGNLRPCCLRAAERALPR